MDTSDSGNVINFDFKTKVWGKSVELNNEYEALGFYLTQHPLEDFKVFLKKNNFLTYQDIENSIVNLKNDEKRFYKIAALPVDMKERTSKKGNKYAYVQFSDNTANFEAIVFSDILNTSSELIKNHNLLLITLEVSKEENNISLRVQDVISLKKFINESSNKINILIDEKIDLKNLKNNLDKYKSEEGSKVNLLINRKNKLINISIKGKYDYFNIINNKMKEIKLLN